jgi:hypothetical protein
MKINNIEVQNKNTRRRAGAPQALAAPVNAS